MRSLPLLALLYACTGAKVPGGGAEGEGEGEGEGQPECTIDTDCGDGQICEGESCEDGDRNNSADEAETLLWDSSARGVINPREDVDYYTFTADGGEFVRINTVLDETDREVTDEAGYDTAVVLRSPSGKVVASVNDYPTGQRVNSYDAVLYAYLAVGGTYTIEVEDAGDLDADIKLTTGSPDYGYTVDLSEVDGHTRETDAIDDPSLRATLSSGNTLTALGVLLEEPGDSDWVEVQFPYGDAGLYVLGMDDLGDSDAIPEVRMYDEDAQLLTDKEGVAGGHVALYPAMQDAQYTLELTDSDGEGGDNNWYFVFLYPQSEGDAYDAEEEPNDDQTSATELTQYTSQADSGDYTYARIQGDLAEVGDQDWFSAQGMDDGYMIVCLNSANYGSTVAPTVSVYDEAGTLLETDEGDESASNGTTIVNLLPTTDQTYGIAVTAPADESGLSAWYKMLVYVTSFETDTFSCP